MNQPLDADIEHGNQAGQSADSMATFPKILLMRCLSLLVHLGRNLRYLRDHGDETADESVYPALFDFL